jgi:hypothetical protein
MSDNPNMQCERCGKWRRLNAADGDQLMHPYYIEDDDSSLIALYDCLCVQCQHDLNGFQKELKRAYKVGLEMAA